MKGKQTTTRLGAILMLAVMLIGFASLQETPSMGSVLGATTASAEGGPTKILLWNEIFEDWNYNFFSQKFAEFNEVQSEYVLEVEFMAADVLASRLAAAQASGSAPDIYMTRYNFLPSLANSELIMPLNDVFDASVFEDYFDNVQDMISYNGQFYAIPQLLETMQVLYYRKDLFEQAGIAEAPKTWDDLYEAAKALTTPDRFGLMVPGFDIYHPFWSWSYIATGHSLLSDDWTEPTINNEGNRKLAAFFKKLYDEKLVPEQPTPFVLITPYGEEQMAMHFSGSWAWANLLDVYPDIAAVTGVVPVPTLDGVSGTPTSTVGGYCYVLDAKNKNVEGSVALLNWLINDDPAIMAEFFKITKFTKTSPRKAVETLLNRDEATALDPMLIAVSEINRTAISEPIFPADISVTFAAALADIVLYDVDPDKAFADADQTIRDLIAQNDLPSKAPK